MPGVHRTPDLASIIAQAFRRIRALETQQQATYSNGKGQPIINTGYIPGSVPAEYGFQFVNPSLTGTGGSGNLNGQIAFFGEDANGNVGLYYYNGSGTKISQYDQTGLHFYDATGHEVVRLDQTGLHVYDDAGDENARLGLLPNSQYGVGVWNTEHDGSWGWLDYQNYAFGNWSQVGTSQSTTSTTWTDLATAGPSVSLDVGSDGFGLVRASAMTEAPADQTVSVGVSIDGAAPTFAQMQFANGAASPINTPLFAEISYSGLTPGNHTFKLQYETSGGTATFWNRYLFVSNGG